MHILHHIALRLDQEKEAEFRKAGVLFKKAPIISSFDIAEDDPRWPQVFPLTRKFKVFDTVTTKFSAAELNQAAFLGMAAAGHHGYPEPSDDNGYLKATFDLSQYCPACGTGLKQTAPFRLKNVPKLSRSLLQLNWVLDEYFAAAGLWKEVFKPLGIGSRPVVLDKNGSVIDEIVQLVITQESDLDLDGQDFQCCASCSRKKYAVSFRGFFPAVAGSPQASLFKSAQYFGPGAMAYRLVLASGPAYRSLAQAKIRGVHFYPCAQKS
jgi:hypothetical protein